jgi:hypothetical protein
MVGGIWKCVNVEYIEWDSLVVAVHARKACSGLRNKLMHSIRLRSAADKGSAQMPHLSGM